MPIVDYDGGLIQQLVVEYHPEGTGPYIEKIEKLTECPECGFGKATYSYRSHAGHHTVRAWNCPSCGHYENNA
jgi:rubredoxin